MTVDSLCNGKVTADTPPEAIHTGLLVDLEPIVESYDPAWVFATRNWVGSHAADGTTDGEDGYITNYKDEVCIRPSSEGAVIRVSTNLQDGSSRPFGRASITVSYNSTNPIRKIRMLQGDTQIHSEILETPNTSGEIKFDVNF